MSDVDSSEDLEEEETLDIVEKIYTAGSPYMYECAHLSTCKYENNSIIICGGISNDFDFDEYVWKLDIETNKYQKFFRCPPVADGNRTFYANKKLFFFSHQNDLHILDGNKLLKTQLQFGFDLTIGNGRESTMTLTKDKKFIHIVGGTDLKFNHFKLNTSTCKLTKLSIPPFQYNGSKITNCDDKNILYLFPGITGAVFEDIDDYDDELNVYSYNIKLDKWNKINCNFEEKNWYNFSLVRYYNYVLFLGGEIDDTYTNEMFVFDLDTNKMMGLNFFYPFKCIGISATVIDNEIHCFGGRILEDEQIFYTKYYNDHVVIVLKDLMKQYDNTLSYFLRSVGIDVTGNITDIILNFLLSKH